MDIIENLPLDKALKGVHEIIEKFEEYESNFDKYFVLHEESKDVVTHKHESPHHPVVVRGKMTIHHPVDKIWKFLAFSSADVQKQFNHELSQQEIMKKIDDNTVIIREQYSPGVWGMSDREMLFFRHFLPSKNDSNVHYIVNWSIDGPVLTSGCIRAESLFGIMKLTKLDDKKTEYIIYNQVKLGGWLPQWIIDKSIMGAPKKMLQLNNHIK